jgi:NAD-dependent deacetylase
MTNVDAHILADLIRNSRGFAVLTGAGISTDSGLPDFRSADGLWSRYDPEVAGHIRTFKRDPKLVWSYYHDRLTLDNPQPNPGHEAVAHLVGLDNCTGLITQNVDGLHERAGAKAVNIHGTLAEAACVGHKHIVPIQDALTLREQQEGVPRCPQCNSNLKPNVVLFGELLDKSTVQMANRIVNKADLLLCLGTSLQVYPVAQYPQEILDRGHDLAIVTQGETPYDHKRLAYRSHENLSELLSAVVSAL